MTTTNYAYDPDRWTTGDVLRMIAEERVRQEDIWGRQHHHEADWLVILTEELGEVAKEICESCLQEGHPIVPPDLRRDRLVLELVHLAAVAVGHIEDIYNRYDGG